METLYLNGEALTEGVDALYDPDEHRLQLGSESHSLQCGNCGHWFDDLPEDGADLVTCPECDDEVGVTLGHFFNSAFIALDPSEWAVRVGISVGDPRGSFVWTVRRWKGRYLIHGPHPSEGLPHMATRQLRPGTLETCEYDHEKHQRYTIQAGRGILCDGVHLVSLQRNESMRGDASQMERDEHGHPVQACVPTRADAMARRFVELLNEYGE